MLTEAHRWIAGARFRLDVADRELGEDRVIRGVVLSIDEFADTCMVAIDGVPLPVACALEILTPEREAA